MSENSAEWTEEDDAELAYEALPAWHPSLLVDVFRAGLERNTPAEVLAAFVTPESLRSWGSFSRARDVFSIGLKISTTALYGVDAPDVSYVRLVETSAHTITSVRDVPATMHATLVWRPEISIVPNNSWRIHQIGEAIHPRQLPRTAEGIDPRNSSRNF